MRIKNTEFLLHPNSYTSSIDQENIVKPSEISRLPTSNSVLIKACKPQNKTAFKDLYCRREKGDPTRTGPSIVLGKGFFGTVKMRYSKEKKVWVAVKTNKSDKIGYHNFSMLADEARILANLDSPFIIKLVDFALGTHRTTNKPKGFLALELFGKSIDQLKKSGETFSETQIAQIAHDVLKGIEYLQNMGYIHNDIQEGNILVKNGRAKLTDFGLCYRMTGNDPSSEETHKRFDCVSLGNVILELFTTEEGVQLLAGRDDLAIDFFYLCMSPAVTISKMTSHPWLKGCME